MLSTGLQTALILLWEMGTLKSSQSKTSQQMEDTFEDQIWKPRSIYPVLNVRPHQKTTCNSFWKTELIQQNTITCSDGIL